jgi:hypothetical protein
MDRQMRHRRFARGLVSAAVVVGIGLATAGESGHAVLSAEAPEFGYSGDNGPGFRAETPG